MREQDILNQIKASAEDVEIPESLMPDNIEKMLKELAEQQAKSGSEGNAVKEDITKEKAAKKVRFRFQPMHLVAASVALVFMIGLIPLGLGMGAGNDGAATGQMDSNQNTSASVIAGDDKVESAEEVVQETIVVAKKQDAGELYQVAKSYEEIYDFIEMEAEEYYYCYYDVPDWVFWEEVVEEAVPEALVGTAPTEKQSSGATEAPTDNIRNEVVQDAVEDLNYSKTNVQVEGVDESDIVKTNGTHIFSVKNHIVTITKVKDGQLEKVGTIAPKLASFTDQVLEMYVDDDRLVLIVQQAKEMMTDEPAAWGEGPIDDEIMVDTASQSVKLAVDVAYNFLTTYNTVLYTYDISDPSRPVQIGQMEQDGNYNTSRKIGDIIYLFTYDGVVLDVKKTEKGEAIADLLPKVNGETFAYDSIYLPERGTQGLVVSSVSLDNPNTVVDKTLILNDYVNIYVSTDGLYLYRCNYASNMEVTEIAKFSLDEGRILAVAASSVPGSIQDTFAINEYEGNLRVLTSGSRINGVRERTNQLYILDTDLKPAGKIENIAPDETIYAARYFGDLAYFITYRNTDPLFAADLSDINNPKILGELEITGYSEYLHMWGEDKLLGIGYETDPKTGRNKGLKLVMFDISNPAELSILDTVVLKDIDYSAALYHYKCVLADNTANMIGFPVTEYGDYSYGSGYGVGYQMYSFVDGQFKEELYVDLGKTSNDVDIRGLYIGKYFYLVWDEGIESYLSTDSYKEVSELKF